MVFFGTLQSILQLFALNIMDGNIIYKHVLKPQSNVIFFFFFLELYFFSKDAFYCSKV